MVTDRILSERTREKLHRIPVSAITTALSSHGLHRMFMLGVRAIGPESPRLVGQAFTMRYIPSRPDLDTVESFSRPDALQRIALEECAPGDVLVVDARGDVTSACAGDAYTQRLHKRGCAGIVTDGGLRDVGSIAASGFPAYLGAPASPPTFVAHHPVDVQVPIGCGGVPVFPGDVIVGDEDGVVVIPIDVVDAVVDAAWQTVEYDEFVDEKLAEGRPLIGLYPSTEDSRAEYRLWRAARS